MNEIFGNAANFSTLNDIVLESFYQSWLQALLTTDVMCSSNFNYRISSNRSPRLLLEQQCQTYSRLVLETLLLLEPPGSPINMYFKHQDYWFCIYYRKAKYRERCNQLYGIRPQTPGFYQRPGLYLRPGFELEEMRYLSMVISVI